MFIHAMKWDDDIFLEKTSNTRRGNLQLSMYAMHLATGSTLLCRQITLKTIKEYVKAAASFIALGSRQTDFRKENQTDTQMCQSLQAVYKELERWEKIPNRREPFTLEMLDQLDDTIKKQCIDQDSLQGALADWFTTCLFLGSRKSEWAQDAGKSALEQYKKSPLKRAHAFTLGDIEFHLLDGRRIQASDLPIYPSTNYPTRVWVTHSWQKNGEHGEKRLFMRNTKARVDVLVEHGSALFGDSCGCADTPISKPPWHCIAEGWASCD
jgi:hypothetical protein